MPLSSTLSAYRKDQNSNHKRYNHEPFPAISHYRLICPWQHWNHAIFGNNFLVAAAYGKPAGVNNLGFLQTTPITLVPPSRLGNSFHGQQITLFVNHAFNQPVIVKTALLGRQTVLHHHCIQGCSHPDTTNLKLIQGNCLLGPPKRLRPTQTENRCH
jgi:hypothetical protein